MRRGHLGALLSRWDLVRGGDGWCGGALGIGADPPRRAGIVLGGACLHHDTLYASFQVPFRFTDGASFSTREEFEAALPQLLPREFRAELLELDPHIGGDSIAYTLPYRSPLGIGRIEAQRIDGAWRIVRIVLFA